MHESDHWNPFRQMLKPEQRKDLDSYVVRANAFIAAKRG